MKKRLALLIIIITINLTSCGKSSSEEAKELQTQMLTVVGIPPDIITNICQDGNDDGLCDSSELSKISVKNNFFSKIVLGEGNSYELNNYDPTKKIIMELQDNKNIEFNDGNFSLEYKGTSSELSILQSMVDSDDISTEDIKNVKDMEGKDTFYEVLLSSMEKNLNKYMKNDMLHRSAREVNLKELGRLFQEDIPLKDLNQKIQEQCHGDKECIKSLIKSFSVNLDTDEQSIYTLAQARRKVKLLNDKLIEGLTCKSDEKKIVKHYGFEDIFNLKNRDENAHPAFDIVKLIGKENLKNYDVSNNRKIFAESLRELPRRIKNGKVYIGLKKSGGKLNSQDKIYIGKYNKENSNRYFSSKLVELQNQNWLHQPITKDDPTTEIYYTDLKNIVFNDKNTTLLDYLSRNNRFDAVIAKNTAVDFISIATCSTVNPKLEIKEAVNAFSCNNKKDRLIKIIGGRVDAFSKDRDKLSTPSELLLSTINKPLIGYDELANNKFFLDTLKIPKNITITQAQFSVGIKPLPKYLYQNDTINIGNYELEKYSRFKLYGNDDDSVLNIWTKNIRISNGERVLQTKLGDINVTDEVDTSLLDVLNRSNNAFDILIQNDTSVDFTYLNLCIEEK